MEESLNRRERRVFERVKRRWARRDLLAARRFAVESGVPRCDLAGLSEEQCYEAAAAVVLESSGVGLPRVAGAVDGPGLGELVGIIRELEGSDESSG